MINQYATLIRYALWAALVIGCACFVWWMSATIKDNIYQDGRKAERAEWLAKEEKRNMELASEIASAAEALAAEREKQVNGLTEALNEQIRAKDKLNDDLASIRVANRGLWIGAENCRKNTGGKTGEEIKGAGIGSEETGRIRLPEQIESDLWKLAADAQRVVIQYETCRKTLLPLVEVVPDSAP